MELKDKVINRANGHFDTNRRLRGGMHSRWKRCFVLCYPDGRISDIKATKRSAESKIEGLKNNSYYDETTMKMTTCGSALQVVEVKEEELLPLNSFQLLYNSLWNDYRNLGGMSFNFKSYYYFIEKNDLPETWKSIVKGYGEEAQSGSFSIKQEYEKNKIDIRDLY